MISLHTVSKKHIIIFVIAMVIAILLGQGLFHQFKPLSSGLSFRGEQYRPCGSQVKFLHDLTWYEGTTQCKEQEIFDSVFALIDRADRYILIDMFLFNDQTGKSDRSFRDLSGELTEHLIRKKKSNCETVIDVITDPINTVYGGSHSPILERLKKNGINVIITDLAKLRDSNRLYSPFWRLLFQWWGNSAKGGLFPHPFSASEKKVTLRSYLTLLNFKANHRKIILTDADSTWSAIVASANPHDASADHSNTAFIIKGKACGDLYTCESAVARFSGGTLGKLPDFQPVSDTSSSRLNLRFFTEGAIRGELVHRISSANGSDTVFVAVFYLSDRKVVHSFGDAAHRGVSVNITLDPNTNAFGYKKNGIPNLPVAAELIKKGCSVSFYHTSHEQFHTKIISINYASDSIWVMTGSANYTRRNLGDLNLELNCAISGNKATLFAQQVIAYNNRLFSGDIKQQLTLPLSSVGKPGLFSTLRYRFFEASGFSSF